MGLPNYPIRAQVLSHDSENDGVYCMTPTGQILPLVRRLYPHADGLRMSKPPMPVRGSWVMLQFPGGDARNGFMLGAFHPNLVDALPNGPDDPFSHYDSNFDGSWSYRSGLSGFIAHQFSDNSSLVIGSGTLNVPQMFRHTVDGNQKQQRVPYNQSDRNPNPQPPFGVNYTQTTSGSVGGFNFKLTPQGSLAVSSAVTGQTMSITYNGTVINIDGAGNANINAGNNTITLTATNIILAGEVFLGGASASKEVAFRGTVDSNGDTLVSNFATKVKAL